MNKQYSLGCQEFINPGFLPTLLSVPDLQNFDAGPTSKLVLLATGSSRIGCRAEILFVSGSLLRSLPSLNSIACSLIIFLVKLSSLHSSTCSYGILSSYYLLYYLFNFLCQEKWKILDFLRKSGLKTGWDFLTKPCFLRWNFFSKGCRKFSTHFTTMFKVFRRSAQLSSLRQ